MTSPADEITGLQRGEFPTENEKLLLRIGALAAANEALRQEVLDRRQAEDALRLSEQQWRDVFDNNPTMYFIVDEAGCILSVNPFGAEHLGYAVDELIGHPVLNVFVDADREFVQQKVGSCLEHLGEGMVWEARKVRKNGAVLWVRETARAVRRAESETILLVACEDITDHHQALATLEKAFTEIQELKDQLYRENLALREEVDQTSMFEDIVGSSEPLRRALGHVTKVAPTDSTVLITGETGTGKELIARAIHKRSPRSHRAFVSVNCSAIPHSLIASELFGYEKGAFTGATERRLGRFELADGGTLFLDEVGELPAETQIALLRVLQEQEFERVGGSRPVSVDVRVLAATNRNLLTAVETGTLRQDLFYRLNVFPIQVPSLRERAEDIPGLVEYLIARYARKAGKHIRNIDKRTLELFRASSWPGNVRELQNVVERAVILCEGDTFSVEASWLTLESVQSAPAREPLSETLAARQKELIEAALTETRGKVAGPSGAAAKLGMKSSTLESKIRSLSIDKRNFTADRCYR